MISMTSIKTILMAFLAVFFIQACKDSSSGLEPEPITGTIQIEPSLVRTYVGDPNINLKVQIENQPTDAITHVEWTSSSPAVAAVDDHGTVEVLDLGKTAIIASLTGKDGSVVASDTSILYSEAKLTLETEVKSLRSITDIGDENGIFIGSDGVPNLYLSTDYGDSWHLYEISSMGSIHEIERAPTNPEYLIARAFKKGTDFMTIYSSVDNGTTWREMEHPFDSSNADEKFGKLSDLSFSINSSSTIYAAASIEIYNGHDFIENHVRLYKSTNLGESWDMTGNFNREESGEPNSYTPKIFTDSSNPDRLYISPKNLSNRLFVSKDGGNFWDIPSWDFIGSLLNVGEDGVLYYSSVTALHISMDQGQNWNPIIAETDSTFMTDVDLFKVETIVVLETQFKNYGHLIKLSTDNGNLWNVYPLSFNDEKVSALPNGVKLLRFNNEYAELLISWGGTYLDSDIRDQVWKVRWFYNL